MAKRTPTQKPLAGRVAVVAGATRGAGRGIARALGEAGAIVYCTGRSVTGNPSPYKRPETIDETAEMIGAAGGTAIPVRVDHSNEREVEALFTQVDREHGRLDILVNSVAGEDPLAGAYGWFWDADLTNASKALENSLLSHVITSKHGSKLMMRARSGLIVEVTEGDALGAGGNPVKQIVKLALKGLALSMAAELHPHGVAVVSITPGFLRSESMLEGFGVTEKNWRDGGKKDKNFLESESPLYVGRAVAALAGDPKTMTRTGQLFSSWELARAYKFTDYDGRRPDWGRLKIDFSGMPPDFLTYFHIGGRLTLEWLERVTARTRSFGKQLPKEGRPGQPRPRKAGPTASAKATAVRRTVSRRPKPRTRATAAKKGTGRR
ncbi:MAG TPA: SDR family NAD(P)-dependent oxidoreductase [Vicinamibacterales bacterium]|nr:SDR family NAD(P)-dependent oxidoreductase [Vicinamibacterales bacterium]